MLRHLQAAAYCADHGDAEHGGDCIDHNWMSVYRRGLFGTLSLNTFYALQKRGLVESVIQRFGNNNWDTETFRITDAGRAALGAARGAAPARPVADAPNIDVPDLLARLHQKVVAAAPTAQPDLRQPSPAALAALSRDDEPTTETDPYRDYPRSLNGDIHDLPVDQTTAPDAAPRSALTAGERQQVYEIGGRKDGWAELIEAYGYDGVGEDAVNNRFDEMVGDLNTLLAIIDRLTGSEAK